MKLQVDNENLRLIVFSSAKKLGESIDKLLLKKYNLDEDKYTFIVPIKEIFFEDGHLKVELEDTVRGKNVFLITDIGNYSVTYNMHMNINHASPNDLVMQLKDGIGACNSHARSVNIVMPLLFNGRQHRRNTRENLGCGQFLRELDECKKLESFVTFDAHDQGVEHALHNYQFDNVFATIPILRQFINDLDKERLKNLVFVAPDNGAAGRRNIYLNCFSSKYINKEAGSFIKQRDFNTLIDGKYPIISHDYCGNNDLDGKTAIIVDDMISSGNSMFDVINGLKERNIKYVYIIVTYTLFTKGIEKFEEYFNKGLLDGVYTTNLSYIPASYKACKWLHICDCGELATEVIYSLHNDISITKLLSDKSEPLKLLEEKFK